MKIPKTSGLLEAFLLIFLVSIAGISPLNAQEIPITGEEGVAAQAPAATFVVGRMIGMRPEEKRPLKLSANERNPYAKRSIAEEPKDGNGENAEEIQIRERLNALSVTGQSQGPNGLRILLGDIILEQGRTLPQLLEDQSESLQVIQISEDTVVLGWLDIETGEPTGKTMQVGYDLTPQVNYALHGQNAAAGSGEIMERRMGVLRIGQDRKRTEAKMVLQDKSPEIPREVFEAGQ